MSQPHHLVRLRIALSPADCRVFAAAARILTRIMGAQAPSVTALIQMQLSGRDPVGIADHYLDSVGWPLEKGRAVSLRPSLLNPRRTGSTKTTSRSPRRSPRHPLVD